jgi:Putative MetA-pathway of phenol degradation
MLLLCLALFYNSDPDITVNPNRPTFASPAATTQVSVIEMELGVQHTQNRDASTMGVLPGLVKYGLSENFEARLGFNGVTLSAVPGEPRVTQGPSLPSAGFQWLYSEPGAWGVAQSIQVTHTLPTPNNLASTTANMIFSSDFATGFHADINLLITRLNTGNGTATQYAQAVSLSKTVTDSWSCGSEVYTLGPTRLAGRSYSNLYYIAYKLNPRLVLDIGTDIGLNKNAQKYSIFAGITIGIHRFK